MASTLAQPQDGADPSPEPGRQATPPVPPTPPRAGRTARSKSLYALIGAGANATAILTFIGQAPHLLMVLAALLPIGLGGYILRRNWGRPAGVLVLTACASLVAGAFVLANADLPFLSPGSALGEVRLTPQRGVDLDSGKHESVDTEGPSGEIDVFLDSYYLRANGGSFYRDDEADADSGSACSTPPVNRARGSVAQVMPIVGEQYCFLTSERHLAWLRVNDAGGTGSASYVDLNVKVFGPANAS